MVTKETIKNFNYFKKYFSPGLRKFACCVLTAVSFLALTSCSNPLYKKKFIILGTYLEITSADKEAANIVYQEVKRLDKIFSSYDLESELTLLTSTYNEPFKCSDELIEILKLSKDMYKLTNGAFDVSCGVIFKFWKTLITQGEVKALPSQEKIKELREKCGIENIVINETEKTVVLKKKGLMIDLGGIAKGYIVDKACQKLKEKGIYNALINAGGDLYALGTNNGNPWKIGIQDPDILGGIIETQILIDEGIATSGDYEQFFEFEGKRYSHLIDPRTGYPAENKIVSVSVITKNCTTADSFATAFSVMGVEATKVFLTKNVSTMRIFVVTKDEKGEHIDFFQ
ncbi:MAG: FAD:protein FMN transferase [Candidatus Omnitrophica bacterium]|nr:FAD:protein FMN transferase [Candidatus Omnitrophota bacterium]